jgi:hypothetical protein
LRPKNPAVSAQYARAAQIYPVTSVYSALPDMPFANSRAGC